MYKYQNIHAFTGQLMAESCVWFIILSITPLNKQIVNWWIVLVVWDAIGTSK